MLHEVYYGLSSLFGFEPKMLKFMRNHCAQISFGAENGHVSVDLAAFSTCSLILLTKNVCVTILGIYQM